MSTDATTWWQMVVDATTAILVLGGLFMLVRLARGRGTRMTAKIALGSLLVGAGGRVATRDLVAPMRELRIEAAPLYSVSEGAFESADLPALSLRAPRGWRVEFDEARAAVHASLAAGDGRETKALLIIQTFLTKEHVEATRLLSAVQRVLVPAGFHVGAPFEETIDRAPAVGFTASGDRDVCAWVVRRSAHVATSLQCVAPRGGDCRAACKGAIDGIRWLRPIGVAPSDL